jgi:hypothetical protein
MDSIQEVEPSSIVNDVSDINNKSFNMHSELKKLTHLERVQLYNKVRIEEEQEQEKERNELEKKEQEKQMSNCNGNGNSNGNCNMSNCRQINAQYQSVFSELRGLRIQIQQLQNEMQYLNNNNNIQNIQNKSQLQRNNFEEYENDDTCSIFSLICDWMPIWIFVSFILFTLTSKPKLCSISGTGIGSCPIAGLGEMFTKL